MGDVARSVLDRLRNRARRLGVSHQLVLQLFCQEEFLRRLAASPYRERFVLKGGLLLYSLSGFSGRPTMDVDVLMRGISNELGTVENVIRAILESPSDNDIVAFSVTQSEPIAEARQYSGVRVRVIGRIGNTKTPFHIDVAVGDLIVPKPIDREIPTQLEGFERPTVLTYSLESTVAEKLDCIIARMELNSRMKDLYDIFYIAGGYRLDGRTLQEALYQTLQRRGTAYERDTMEKVRGLRASPTVQTRWALYADGIAIASSHLPLEIGEQRVLILCYVWITPSMMASATVGSAMPGPPTGWPSGADHRSTGWPPSSG